MRRATRSGTGKILAGLGPIFADVDDASGPFARAAGHAVDVRTKEKIHRARGFVAATSSRKDLVGLLSVMADEVLRFVREEALQDEQFAANMWRRATTSSPQLTFYYLGYKRVWDLYDAVRTARGEDFVLREFMDGMMEMGPVSVEHYWEQFGLEKPSG